MTNEDKILIKQPRSHKDGHLFEVNNNAVEWIEQYQHFKGVTKSIVELLNLISLRGMTSKDGLVSTTELIDATDGQITRAAIQQRLRAAVNIGLFKQTPVRFETGLAGKTMLHHFVNPSLLITALGTGSLQTESTKTTAKKKKTQALAQTHVNKQLLSEHGLNNPPAMLDEAEQFVVSPTNWAGIIDQALAPPRTRKNYQKSMVSISGTRAVIETRSSKNIMTVDDLMTLFALFTLTVQYHDHHQDSYHINAQVAPNKTPLYITDILSLRGKKDSGPARDSIRDSIDRIEYTDFQLHELTGQWLSENMPEGFKSDRFRFLARTITASEEAPTENEAGEIKIKPNLYILVWEPSFYEELLTKDYFFLFPPEILRQHTLVFQLYSYFRSRMSRRSSDMMLLSELNQKLARNIEWRRFSMDLLRELKKLSKGKGNDELFVVNLWGYHLTLSALEPKGKVKDYQVDIKCNAEEVVRYARARTTNAGKRNMAPTLPNPLRHEMVSKQKLEELAEIIDGEFEPIQRKKSSPRGNLGRRVKLRKHLVEINAEEITISLTKYTSPEALERSITALSAMTGHSPTSIREECQELLEKLDWLRVGDKVVSYEALSRTIELYNQDSSGAHLTIERLILGLAVRRKVCRQILEGHYDETVMRVLREIASGS
ncbi:replication initiator protein RctB domain-containing protein [Vibrio breoganii]|uniref:Translation elongation factor n=1 Tax=Vibrio breoganii TaxID=553239 RepID=A0AAP8MVR6_9VIBR|nr:replication initiator protein RctB domain-containing protein [Vibrio breoganii]PML95472.1 translation elongation factor [Vibrio breoganii]PMM19081.1 translation elongation factor [Vibrio breoganii]PMN60421.1 translation elongation factor [Vibrio breoganii]PMP08337.1 translation elongation factor [Vibrio breoganii]